MKKKLRTLLSCLVLCCLITTAKPISETTAEVSAVAGGLGVTGVALALVAGQDARYIEPSSRFLMGAASCLAGLAVWFALRELLYSFTPKGRVESAERVINEIVNDELIARCFQTDFDVISSINVRFYVNWPLVAARNLLANYTSSLKITRESLINARQEMGQNPFKYKGYIETSTILLKKTVELTAIIEQRMSSILMCIDYAPQLRLYEQHLEAERQRELERELLWSQQRYNAAEKERERQYKERIVNQTVHGPVNVNVTI